jgi:hypothetical protein
MCRATAVAVRNWAVADLLDVLGAAVAVGQVAFESGSPAGREHPVQVVGHQQLLLMLDNCEHVIEAAAELAGLLLQSASGLRILATSLEPLGISGERLQAVPPLEVPDTTASAEPSELERFSSVQLFVTRASAAAPGFALDAGNARAVASICRRLDGIPLALELAATRVQVLGVRGAGPPGFHSRVRTRQRAGHRHRRAPARPPEISRPPRDIRSRSIAAPPAVSPSESGRGRR